MDNQIINNLSEFWKHVGSLNNSLIETEKYSAVSVNGSDWPNRIFDVKPDYKLIEEIKKLSERNELPGIITIASPNDLNDDPDFEFVFGQTNMALNMNLVSLDVPEKPNIKRVKTEKDSLEFANIASESFGYRVDHNVILTIVNRSESIRLFVYREGSECLGCGIVFFDSENNAGLHQIGTIPKGRGKGIAKSMTRRLLKEAKENKSNHCVLHASSMGEPIYKQLGFKAYGKIETYRLAKNKS